MLRSVPRIYKINNELLGGGITKVPTHELFTKLGLVSHPKPGLVNYLPMGLEVLTKIQAIIQENMNASGAEQVRMATLSSSQVWERSGRWGGSELFKLKDSSAQEFCLAPTCEEEITELVKSQASSYKDYPLLYYQINTKFRDEKRPRSGLLRGREFVMKDAYSFDITSAAGMRSYELMVSTYEKIFDAFRVPYVKAEADTGEIGGLLSHEWHYVHETGEDTLFTCDGCRELLNIEKTLSYPKETPTAENCSGAVSVKYFTTADLRTLVCAYYPSDRTLEPNFIKEEIPDVDIHSPLSQDQILSEFGDEETLISKRIVRVMDLRLHLQSNFPDFPIKFINKSLITTLTDIPIVAAKEGELCHKCEDGLLVKNRAIEVGHTFYLGEKYSAIFGLRAEVPHEKASVKTNIVMGCYGLGISRIMAAIAETQRDEHGLRWPACIAPWQVTVISAGRDLGELAEKLSSVDFCVDDRDVRLGRKIKYSHMFGIPLAVILGRNYPQVEIEVRGKIYGQRWREVQELTPSWTNTDIKHSVHIDDVGTAVRALLNDM